MKLLAIDTSTEACSVALQVGSESIHLDEVCPQQHSKRVLPMVQQLLRQGHKVAIHCKGGSGRTGLVAAKILLEAGFDKIDVKQRVQVLRPYALTLQPHLDWFNAQ